MEKQELVWNRPEGIVKEPIMMLDAWTQTTENFERDDAASSVFEDEVMKKIQNILGQMQNQSKRIDELSQRRYSPALTACDESEFYPKKFSPSDLLKVEVQQINEDYKQATASAEISSINLNVTEVKMNKDNEMLPVCPDSVEIVGKFEESHQFSRRLKRKRHLIATSTPYNETKKVLKFNSSVVSSSSNVAYVKPIPTKHTSIVITTTDEEMVVLGPNNTQIPKIVFDSISWKSTSIATRKLLMAMFDRYTLATHSMSGKPSPAFKNDKPLKEMLNPAVIADIIFAVKCKCGSSERDIRNAITTKCADENKMLKLKERKNKENLN